MATPGGLTRKRKARSEQVVPGIEPSPSPVLGCRVSQDGHTGSGSAGGGPVDPGPDYPIPNFDDVYSRMRHPETGFVVADRRWRLLNYPKCFIGKEAVDWMIRNLNMNRAMAINTGQHLMDAGIVHHVTHSEPFCDEYYFFRFQEDDESSVLNMKRVWDPSLPSRPPVEVSQGLLTRLACLCEEYRHRVINNLPLTPRLQSHAPGTRTSAVSHKTSDGTAPDSSGPPSAYTQGEMNSGASRATSPMLSGPGRLLSETLISASSTSFASPSWESSAYTSSGNSSVRSATVGSAADVDYEMLAKSEEFRAYTLAAAELQRVQLLGLSHDERIAFFVNVYNALCLHCYVVKGAPTTVFRRWVFFRMLSYRIAGLDMTLDDIEHGILRGNKRAPMIKILQQLRPADPKCQHVLTKRDGRIHFVISAGTASDPPIRILNGENVQEELHDATVEFLSYSVKIDTSARTVTLPRIFMWYADDFPSPERTLLEWVGQYLLAESAAALASILGKDEPVPSITYENFDWCASDARFNAAVVRRKRRRLEREFAAAQAGLLPMPAQNVLHGTFAFQVQQPFGNATPGSPLCPRVSEPAPPIVDAPYLDRVQQSSDATGFEELVGIAQGQPPLPGSTPPGCKEELQS